ncbi:hypothetical protein LINGRAPRIM_LOCUS961 [Linum grandiflorum]
MTVDLELRRLCSLVDESLRPFIVSSLTPRFPDTLILNLNLNFSFSQSELEIGSVRYTKEKEKDLLIALSKVYTEIQVWIRQLEVDSVEENTVSECLLEAAHEDHNCLMRILDESILLLTVDSRFIKHSVGKILVTISEFLDISGSKSDAFVDSLFMCLALILKRLLSCSITPRSAGNSNFDSSDLAVLIKGLVHADWSTAAQMIQILRNVLKNLKQESEDECFQAYEKSVCSFLKNVPWDCMDDICAEEPDVVVFLGSFVPFVCSLVEQATTPETKVHLQDQHSTISIVVNLVPKLLCWCVGKRESIEQSTFHYFTHKLLMLMLRLSYVTQLSCTTLVCWLQLLHDYFEELLLKPICRVKPGQYNSLEGSPFLSSLLEEETKDMHSLHSQRQAILLFLRCCLSLTSLTGESIYQDPSTDNSFSTINWVPDLDSSHKTKGMTELYRWIQHHLQNDITFETETYMDNHILFAQSFLQLYLHEDDLLFQVLLQLVSASSGLEQQSGVGKRMFRDAENDIGYIVSNLFNPVKLFHLFLSELHYDHQVLLDYLISKDLGIKCAEYLLRCLRAICSSWHLFIEFSIEGKTTDDLSRKKRKIFSYDSDIQEEESSVLIKDVPLSREKLRIESDYSFKPHETRKQQYVKAKNCLLSLKLSIEHLQRKNLFPYNPKALLKRCVIPPCFFVSLQLLLYLFMLPTNNNRNHVVFEFIRPLPTTIKCTDLMHTYWKSGNFGLLFIFRLAKFEELCYIQDNDNLS